MKVIIISAESSSSSGLPPENLLTAALVPAQHVESVAQCQDRAGTYMACSCGGAEVRCVAFR